MTEPDDLAAFRAEVRTFLAESLPAELARAGRRATSVFAHRDHSIAWQKILTAKVYDMLLAVPKYGKVKATRFINHCRISQGKTVGGLSERQRNELVDLLSR